MWLALRAALYDATPCERSQRINRRNVGKTNRIGKESGSATVSATGSQRLPDKRP